MNIIKFFNRRIEKWYLKVIVAVFVGVATLAITRLLVGAQNILPPEKQIIEERYTQEREEGAQNPAPRDPLFIPEPGSEYEIPTGILENVDPPSGIQDFSFINRWQGMVNDLFVSVSAGGLLSDPLQGKLVVETQRIDYSEDLIPVQEFLTPTEAGPVRIILEKDLKLVLKSSNGTFFLFDVLSRTFEPIRLVSIDLKPGSNVNSINCTNQNELIPFAILSTNDFDALTIDNSTVTLDSGHEYHMNGGTGLTQRHEADANGDGKVDLVFHVLLANTSLNCSSTVGTVTGYTYDNVFIIGSDTIRMIRK